MENFYVKIIQCRFKGGLGHKKRTDAALVPALQPEPFPSGTQDSGPELGGSSALQL